MQQYTHGRPLALVSIAAPKDAALLDRWESHLRPLEQAGLISFWSELHLTPGADRAQEVKHQFDAADIALLLLSADFFNSPDCLALMEQALQRSKERKVRVIPLLLRPVAWQESPLAEMAHWPPGGEPITQWTNQEAAWDACVQSLRRLLGRRVSEALSSERPQKHTDPDWERMLRRLRWSYKELLDQSLHGIAWVELGLATRPDMVSNVTNLLFRFPQGDERLLAPGTSILDAYDEVEEELLVLGAPGAGKTTLLLNLAQHLVDRALADPGHPLPVIFRLSSWAIQQSSLADWMVEQLSRTYDVPQWLSQRWVEQGRLLPLLDGLDEVEEEARPACIAAINEYHRTHLTSLVVCSRQAEYEMAATRERLVLQCAVIVQPLSDRQIEAYLSTAGPSFAGVQTALLQEPALRELATTPLMFSVLLLTYRGASAPEIIQQGTEWERQVWTDYVARQVDEKGNDSCYPLERTRVWLSWLAQQMRVHQQTIFYAEYLQTDWLPLDQQRIAIWLATRLPSVIIGACVCLLVSLFMISGDITVLLQMGLLGGFVGGSLSQQIVTGAIDVTRRHSNGKWVHLSLAVLLGALLAVSTGLHLHMPQPYRDDPGYSWRDWIRDGSIFGLGSGLSFWIFQRLLSRMPGPPGRKGSMRPSGLWDLTVWLTRIASPSIWQVATTLGSGMGLSAGLSAWQNMGLSMGQNTGLSDRLGMGLSMGLSVGLSINVMVVLVHIILAGSIGPLRLAERIHWTWRGLLRPEHLRDSLLLAGALVLFFGLILWLSFGWNNSNGLNGLIHSLSAGLDMGLSFGLNYWVVLGLYQGMKLEPLEDQDRQRFNQGIRRSLGNGLLLGLIGTIITNVLISSIEVLILALIAELDRGLFTSLSNSSSIGLSVAWLWLLVRLLAQTVTIWAFFGGLTVLRHYVIRWHLARSRTFPWRAQAFLDDATTRILLRRVGGGYSFIHRRLQDYFADVAGPPPQQ